MNKARISIPKPPIRMIPNYDSEVSHTFKRSNGYIKYIPPTVEEEENKVEYNLDSHDEVGFWSVLHGSYGCGDTSSTAKRRRSPRSFRWTCSNECSIVQTSMRESTRRSRLW